jgi:CelD/BcsL family acetyltransferase involved in cellulose biosynthesis
VEIDEVTTEEGLAALAEEWARLWERCPQAAVFQSPEWLMAWWRHFGEGDLWVVTMRERAELVGLAPFLIQRAAAEKRRKLRLIGTGVSDYLDVLLQPGGRELLAEALCAHLQKQRSRWDRWELRQLPSGSALLRRRDSTEWPQATSDEVCPVLQLPKRVENLGRVIPEKRLADLQDCRRRLARAGVLQMEIANEKNFDELFEAMWHLHQARWSLKKRPGALADKRVREFHREAARGLLGRGVLRLHAARLNGRIIAALYGFLRRGRACYYLSGFDPAWQRFSPGTIMIGYAIEEAVREGAELFDFLRGQERYKYYWGARDQPTWKLVSS